MDCFPLLSISMVDLSSWEEIGKRRKPSAYCISGFIFVALGGDCNCGILVTLGDCRHLDGLWRIDWWGDLVIVSTPNQGDIVRGSCGSPAECQIPTLVDCSWLGGSPSCEWFLRAPSEGFGTGHLLANHQVGESPNQGTTKVLVDTTRSRGKLASFPRPR